MPIPPFHEILLPLLRQSAAGEDWSLAALRALVANDVVLVF